MVIRLAGLIRTQVTAMAPESLALLPIGSIEQHGLHMPLGVDAMIVEEIANRVAVEVKGKIPVIVCPTQVFGSSHHHLMYSAMSLSGETLIRVLSDLCYSLTQSGFKEILILNSHGGNDESIRIVARDIITRCNVVVGTCSYWDVALPALTSETDVIKTGHRVPGHAGSFETSLMLALQPESVQMELRPPVGEATAGPRDVRGVYIQRTGNSVGRDGYSDDASFATIERGKQYLDIIVREVASALQNFHIRARQTLG